VGGADVLLAERGDGQLGELAEAVAQDRGRRLQRLDVEAALAARLLVAIDQALDGELGGRLDRLDQGKRHAALDAVGALGGNRPGGSDRHCRVVADRV
jgi:hypothetical protein